MVSKRIDKKYKHIEHLSDIGIEIYGDSLEQLFENAGEGMFSIMCDLEKISHSEKRIVKISQKEDTNFEDLLILWLEKLLYIFETENILFSGFKIGKISCQGAGKASQVEKGVTQGSKNSKQNNKLAGKQDKFKLVAEIYGEKIDLERHDIKVAIKAPTYHLLEVKKNGKRCIWEGRVIFDV